MQRGIESIEQALVLLGLNNARRWLFLLSLASLRGAIQDMALPTPVRDALLRGDASMSYKLNVVRALDNAAWDDVACWAE